MAFNHYGIYVLWSFFGRFMAGWKNLGQAGETNGIYCGICSPVGFFWAGYIIMPQGASNFIIVSSGLLLANHKLFLYKEEERSV
jgi:hypothetical protein